MAYEIFNLAGYDLQTLFKSEEEMSLPKWIEEIRLKRIWEPDQVQYVDDLIQALFVAVEALEFLSGLEYSYKAKSALEQIEKIGDGK